MLQYKGNELWGYVDKNLCSKHFRRFPPRFPALSLQFGRLAMSLVRVHRSHAPPKLQPWKRGVLSKIAPFLGPAAGACRHKKDHYQRGPLLLTKLQMIKSCFLATCPNIPREECLGAVSWGAF